MNYYGSKELAQSFRTVRKNTLTIADEIQEDRYGFEPAPGCRSVAEALSHIALSSRLHHQFHGLEHHTSLESFDYRAFVARMQVEEKRPRSKSEVLELLRSEGERFAAWLDGLSDEFPAEQVAMPEGAIPQSKSRFEMILSVKEHEMHHRGQLMLVERMLGIVPHLTREMQARFAAAPPAAAGAQKTS